MKDFVLLSEGGTMPENDEEMKQVMEAWGAWYAALGAAVKDPGNPLGAAKSISSDGAVSDGGGPTNGYIILSAESMEDALAMAKECPVLKGGSSLTVYEAFAMM